MFVSKVNCQQLKISYCESYTIVQKISYCESYTIVQNDDTYRKECVMFTEVG